MVIHAHERKTLCFLVFAAAFVLNIAAAADFYVATSGRDEWSGKLASPGKDGTDGPFATLSRARDAVRKLKQHEHRNIKVYIRGGSYILTESVIFSLDDSAAENQTIEYCAYPGETPVFSSGAKVDRWRKAEPPPPGISEKAEGKLWVADVPELVKLKKERGGNRFLTLYNRGRRLPRARGAGFSPTKTISRNERPSFGCNTLHFPEGTLNRHRFTGDAEIVIVPCHFWTMNILPLESVNTNELVARTAVPGTYPLTRNGMNDRESVWLENVIEVLDEPGEWVFNSTEGRFYLWPIEAEPGDQITTPLLTELIRIEGKIDYDGPKDTPVRGLAFRGLVFTQGERMAWHGGSGRGLQHDWEMFDAPTALVRLRGAEKCIIEDCTFTDSGHTAVRLDLHCMHNRICRNRIERVGGVGILLAGYGPGTKNVNRWNIVRNNYIQHIGQLYWGSVGIFAWQSGENRIEHNHIHHTPYTGIVVSGRISWDPNGNGECSRTVRWSEIGIDPKEKIPRLSWQEREKFLHGRRNIVMANDIHNVMQVLGDGNCIYISGTGTGNLITENYCHDCNGKYMNAVIRCDDDQHGTIIESNVMQRTRGFGEGIISKGDNDILNNIIADLRPDEKHRGLIVFPYGEISGSEIRHNILYAKRKGVVPYYEGRSRQPGKEGPKLETTRTDFNLYYNESEENWMSAFFKEMRPKGVDTHSLEADPMFAASESDLFAFSINSPAKRLGISPVDISTAGLYPELRKVMFGERIYTRIMPESCLVCKPLNVTISASDKSAKIRYTLDGSEPTMDSEPYTKPILLKTGAFVRARSFAEGGTDLTGASVRYASPPPPIIEDFESLEPGSLTPGAETQEENEWMTARISDEKASGGKMSLKFVDGPEQKYPFNPHVFYRTKFKTGEMLGAFDVLIDEKTSFYYQWRDYGDNYKQGPAVQITEGGKVVHAGRELFKVPVGVWVHFEVKCQVGERADGKFDLSVTSPGAEPRHFRGLSCASDFTELDWVGFVSKGVQESVFYIDNIEIRLINSLCF